VSEVPTYTVDIFIAGEPADARRLCREFCMTGLCVTVTPTEFIYTGGAETGVRVGLINYPRFPSTPEELWAKASQLSEVLRRGLCQWSYLLVAPDKSVWVSERPAGQP
jgi:hypothetical protein